MHKVNMHQRATSLWDGSAKGDFSLGGPMILLIVVEEGTLGSTYSTTSKEVDSAWCCTPPLSPVLVPSFSLAAIDPCVALLL